MQPDPAHLSSSPAAPPASAPAARGGSLAAEPMSSSPTSMTIVPQALAEELGERAVFWRPTSLQPNQASAAIDAAIEAVRRSARPGELRRHPRRGADRRPRRAARPGAVSESDSGQPRRHVQHAAAGRGGDDAESRRMPKASGASSSTPPRSPPSKDRSARRPTRRPRAASPR